MPYQTSPTPLTNRLLIRAPALVLVLVALLQIYHTQHGALLTPAKGGGFGLFSTVDKLKNRFVFLYSIDAQGNERPISVAPFLRPGHVFKQALLQARAFPTQHHLQQALRLVAPQVLKPQATALRLEIWKQDFTASSNQIRRLQVGSLTLKRHQL
jgi:hypothetical protein